MQHLNTIDWVALVLVIVGALNWGLVGVFRFDLVSSIFGKETGMSRLVFTLVGIAGLYMVYLVTQLERQM